MGASNRRRDGLTVLATGLLLLAPLACGGSTQDGAKQDNAPANAEPQPNKVGAIRLGPTDGPISEGGTINYGIDAEPEGLDPTRYAFTQAGHAVASVVFEPLATLDENGDPIPYLATGFEPSSDFRTWTVGLPSDVKFHDGKPMDADAVKTCLDAYLASGITGAVAKYYISDVVVKDPTHVVVNLRLPFVKFPLVFTTQAGYIFGAEMLTNTDLAKKPVGTGPYVFDSHVDGQFWLFKRNKDYKGKATPHLDSINFKAVPDPATRNGMLETNDIDILQTNSGPEIKELRSKGAKRVENRFGDKTYLVVNTTKPPFDSLTARKAAAYATDASKWINGLRAGVAGPANSPFGPGQPGYLEDNGYPKYDLAKAKELVAQFEKEQGHKLEFTFLAANDPINAQVVQTFAKDFEDAGMKVTVKQFPQIQLLAQVATGNYEASQFRVFGQPNPDADAHFYRSSSINEGISLNFPRYASKDIDAAADEAIGTADPEKRKAAYEKISRIMAEQLPCLWLGQDVWVIAASARVNGIGGAMNSTMPGVGPKPWIASLSLTK